MSYEKGARTSSRRIHGLSIHVKRTILYTLRANTPNPTYQEQLYRAKLTTPPSRIWFGCSLSTSSWNTSMEVWDKLDNNNTHTHMNTYKRHTQPTMQNNEIQRAFLINLHQWLPLDTKVAMAQTAQETVEEWARRKAWKWRFCAASLLNRYLFQKVFFS